MKSSIDIQDDVYKELIHSPLKAKGKVTGQFKKAHRPANSDKEDVVISTLANNVAQKQEAFVTVNIYVKDNLVNGQHEEDDARLRELCQLCFEVLGSIRGKDYRISFAPDSGQTIIDTEQGEHVISNKLLYQIINE